MREYTKKPESQSRTLNSNPKASRQAPIDVILQQYKEQNMQRYAEDEELIQGKFDTVQREEIDEDELLQGKFESVAFNEQESMQREEKNNNTGMPDNLKSSIESLSGYSMDDVRVHYNSSKPAQLQALAYAQGADIHIAPGQEQHLPHEAWHVVQQKQGRVKPTVQMQGVQVNDEEGLEREANKFSKDIHKNNEMPEAYEDHNFSLKTTIQLAKEGESGPAKGHDYANNIGKLFRDLHLVGLSQGIENAIKIIDECRPQCTALGSEVEGEDINIALYGEWCNRFKIAIQQFLLVSQDSDNEYVRNTLPTIIEELKYLMTIFPEKTIDKRVRTALSEVKVHKDAMDRIDGAITFISQGFLPTLKSFAIARGKLAKGRSTANNCLINAITDAAALDRRTDAQIVEIRRFLQGYGPYDMLDFDEEVLNVIAQNLNITQRPIIVNGERVFINQHIYFFGSPEYNSALLSPNRIVIHHSSLHFKSTPF